ncbi:MAG: DNA helicase UvrD, partial [Nitrospiraceae bacterium]
HYDGHRACTVSLTPDETKKYNYLCPSCGRNVTVGVMHRVDLLADRKHGYKPQGAPPYHSIIPLPEIISEIIRVGVNSKAVASVYGDMIEKLGNEFHILMEASLADIEKASSSLLKEAIAKMRKGKIHITPGYDGEFGKIAVFS